MKYDYWVVVQELIPPIGENRYFAIAQICEIGKGKIEHNLGEVWGKTKDEAEGKMLREIEVWLDKK